MNHGPRGKLWPFYALIGLGMLVLAITVAENSTGLSLSGTVHAVEAGSPVEGAGDSDQDSAAAQGAPSQEEGEPTELESEALGEYSGISDRIIRERDMLGTLRSRFKILEAREEALAKEEEQLEFLPIDIEEKLEELKTRELQIRALLAQADSQRSREMKNLIDIYKGMKPDEINRILGEMEDGMRLEILSGLEPETISKILILQAPKDAAELSAEMVALPGD